MNTTLTKLAELLAVKRRSRRSTVRRRLEVIILTLRGGLTVTQIAQRVRVNRSTVHCYRKHYREGGIERLLSRLEPGRPHYGPSIELEEFMVQGLRRMSWFHLPTFQHWLRYHGHIYSDRTIRRWALAIIARRGLSFPVAWQEQRLVALSDSMPHRVNAHGRRKMSSAHEATLELNLGR